MVPEFVAAYLLACLVVSTEALSVAALTHASPASYCRPCCRLGHGARLQTHPVASGKAIPLYVEGLGITDGVDSAEGNPYLLAGSPEPIDIWCDGSHDPNTQCGGAGAVVVGDENSGRWLLHVHVCSATSVISEWIAVEMALWALHTRLMYEPPVRRPVRVFTDSKNVVDSCTNRTLKKKDSSLLVQHKESVYNAITVLEGTCLSMPISFEWVKGHAGHQLNELADKLAKAENNAKRSASAQEGKWYFH